MPRSSRNTHSGGVDAEQLAGRACRSRLGLADADLARLDDDVELGHHRGDLRALAPASSSRLTTLFVRQAVGSPAAITPSSAATISGRTSPASSASTSAPGHLVAERLATRPRRRASNSSWSSSARSSRAHALRSGLVALTLRMKSSGMLVVGLVVAERLERAGEDHTAEVPQHRSDHGRRLYDGARPPDNLVGAACLAPSADTNDQNDVDTP